MLNNSLSSADAYTQFGEWLQNQAYWLQDAVYCIYHNIRIDDKIIDSYVNMCIAQVKKEKPSFRHLSASELKQKIPSKSIAILGLSAIVGVNALSSNAKLDFSPTGVNVIYGLNGAGKSGYMRIFKQLSGSPYEEPIQPNVFSTSSAERPSCIFNLQINGEEKSGIKCDLSVKDKDSILAECDVFDTRISNGYISRDNSPSFKPFVFSVLTELSNIAGQISNRIHSQIDSISPINLPFPSELSFCDDVSWVKNITARTNISPIYSSWTDAQEKRLNDLPSLLDNEKVKKSLELYKVQRATLVSIYDDLCDANKNISSGIINDAYKAYVTATNQYEIAKKIFSDTADPKDKISVSSRDWKSLWETARRYYESTIYEKSGKHFGEEGSICPLCHQSIVPPFANRFKCINEYLNSSCTETYKHACSDLQRIIYALCDRRFREINSDQILSGILNEVEYVVLQSTYKNIINVKDKIYSNNIEEAYAQIHFLNLEETISMISEKLKYINENISQLNEVLKDEKHIELEKEFNDLLCYKWIYDHIGLITSKINQLKQIKQLDDSLALLNTNKITIESNKLAEALMSEAYLHRFDVERRYLAPKIKVRLEKIPSRKGKAPYKIALESAGNMKPNPEYILSEGEQRIIALAEFFADATGRESNTPLVIDDPISSLDIEYENKATRRIVEIAQDRQVIIFTHRISLLQGISEACEQYGIGCKKIFIQSSPKGKGVPDFTNAYRGSIKEQLKGFTDQITEAKKKESDTAEYRAILSELYQQFRICIERSVEDILLQGMVKRFDHIIHTKGKILKLSRISDADCQIIDSMMTKYSFKEHSQPIDGPLTDITIEELEEDIESFKAWIGEYNKKFNQK